MGEEDRNQECVAFFISLFLVGWASEREVKQAGFESVSDKETAEKAGYTDAAKWAMVRDVEMEKMRIAKKEEADRINAEQEKKRLAEEAEQEKKRIADEAERKRVEAEAKKKEQAEKLCEQDLSCIGNEKSIEASFKCSRPFVERFSKYDFEWIDGMLDTKFPKFEWSNKRDGTITYAGDKIKFQNGFGAKSRMIYECDYNYRLKTVLDVRVQPGRFGVG